MKKIFFILLFYSLGINILFAQKPNSIKIHYSLSQQLKAGNKIDLKVTVSHSLSKEQTGTVTLELIDATTNKSVDGWFLNIFPFQYFTSIKGEKFTTEFPFTVPSDYNGKFTVTIKAVCGNAKDSVSQTFNVNSKINSHE